MSAEIELDQELDKVKFGYAIDYYNDIIGVTARYEVTKSDTELIKIVEKMQEPFVCKYDLAAFGWYSSRF